MLSFTDKQNLYRELTGDNTAAGLLIAKRDINEGAAVFLTELGRKFNREHQTTDLKADQQYYQLPGEVLRISEIRCKNGSTYYEPTYVASELQWNTINNMTVAGTVPLYYYVRGFNEVGLYPIPSADVTDGLAVSYEPQHAELTQDDYTTGTITVTADSTTVTHSASGFLPQMVGRYLQVTDGTDGKWYRIASYTSSSILLLENVFEGIGGSGRTFRIGEMSKIPNGYQDAEVYYAVERFYMTQNDQQTAAVYAMRFKNKLRSAKQAFASSTSRSGVKINATGGRKPNWLDLTKPVTYP